MASHFAATQAGPEQASPSWWNDRYMSGDIPWDTGIVPPEVEQLVSALGAGLNRWALDLGCGSGLTTRYLAAKGYRAVGIDLASVALVRAHRAARGERLPAFFCLADVSDLSFLTVQFSLAIDVGCFHSLPAIRRHSYLESLASHLAPGSPYLLYAFQQAAEDAASGPEGPGIGRVDAAQFAPLFQLRWAAHGSDRGRTAVWYLLERTALPQGHRRA